MKEDAKKCKNLIDESRNKDEQGKSGGDSGVRRDSKNMYER